VFVGTLSYDLCSASVSVLLWSVNKKNVFSIKRKAVKRKANGTLTMDDHDCGCLSPQQTPVTSEEE